MAISNRFILQQRETLAALGRTALTRLLGRGAEAQQVPGPLFEAELPPRSPALIEAYLRWMQLDGRGRYEGVLPFHMFPQWGFGLATQAIARLNYPLMRAVNGGCRLEIHDDLPADEPLLVTAQLVEIDDDGYRAVLTTRICSGTPSVPQGLVADFRTFVPLARRPREEGTEAPRDDKQVSASARALETWSFAANAGLDFARLTGDFNPIHWVPGYARRAGFANTILHGFATMAHAAEGLEQHLRSQGERLREIDVRFTRPLVLPGDAHLFVDDAQVFMGSTPGGPAYMMGTFAPTLSSDGEEDSA